VTRVACKDWAIRQSLSRFVRDLGPEAAAVAEPISGEEIRALRERERLSQAAFARYLNLTVEYVSQLERGVKQPKGPALA
jgi:putative transcriptional regulator